ncbi:MAG: NAD(P)H-dependent oxidoreductase subunit E [Candidatus Margulisiibacteriota bacterium]|jgi:NADH-quinone oxidoreductase subunit E
MPGTKVAKTELSAQLMEFIASWKDKPGNLIMVLHRVQEEYGYVPREVAFQLTEMLDVPLAKIYGVITFYHFFKLKKPGKNIISVCMGTACYLKGGEDLIKEFENMLGIGLNSTTADGKFSLEAVRCIGCCGLAPVMMINDKVYGNLTKEKLPAIFSQYKDK